MVQSVGFRIQVSSEGCDRPTAAPGKI